MESAFGKHLSAVASCHEQKHSRPGCDLPLVILILAAMRGLISLLIDRQLEVEDWDEWPQWT